MTQDTNVCIKRTTDYDTIGHIHGNREIMPSNVEHIMESMMDKQLMVPAIVNEKMELIDGQHRHEACKRLNLPFYYIVVDGYTLKDVQKINAHMKNWSLMDYLSSYVNRYASGESQFVNYKILKDYMNTYSLTLGSAILMADFKMPKKMGEKAFKEGRFEFTNLKASEAFAEHMYIFLKYSPRLYSKIALPKALSKLYYHSSYSYGTMEKNLITQNKLLEDATTDAVTLELLVDIYNYRLTRKAKMHAGVLEDLWKEMIQEEKDEYEENINF